MVQKQLITERRDGFIGRWVVQAYEVYLPIIAHTTQLITT